MEDRFELEIESKLEDLAVIADFITDSMREFGLPDRKIFEIQMAVDEACTNIINYGYIGEEGMIYISCRRRDEDVIVVIKDRAKPFDPTSVPPPDLDASLEARKIGGLGVYFMKTLVDEVKYEYKDGKNVLTMVVKASAR
ncbi:Serine-protein kinase RsbW [ANME-1 cluster archaeon GoMg3.2]|nr:Serine-protein kinase RsbW [ANME-1 cluster archaeon GoMg3.2]